MRQLIGFIILISIVVVPFIAIAGHEIFWFIKCLKEGGDWEYYAVNVLALGIAFLANVAILLIVL